MPSFSLLSHFLAVCITLARARHYLHHGWQFQYKEEWYSAQVPSTIHQDLLANQLIPDPYYGVNQLMLYDLELQDWDYRLLFAASPSEQTLVFEGLDTHCDVYLNDRLVLAANNMFRTWKADVRLQHSNNLTLHFHSAALHDIQRQSQARYALPYNYSYSRKAAYHYGWDWGPRIVTCGIWKDVYLEPIASKLSIASVLVSTLQATSTSADLQFDIAFQHFRIHHLTHQIQILHRETVIHQSQLLHRHHSLRVLIPDPQLWWPRGHGHQALHEFTVKLTDFHHTTDSKTITVGIRSVEWVQQDDEHGQSFYVKINGKPIYMMGANYIPPDMFMPRFHDYARIIQDAVDANYNTLRLWGGGVYEKDEFYELCDREGLMVWHDLMFACAFYPADDDFLENVREEVIDNVLRLRNHPSIVIWNGNNEIDIGWKEWGWKKNRTEQEISEMESWYQRLFLEVIPNILAEMDPHRFYYPTSPSSSFNELELTRGDIHFWGVWAAKFEIEWYSTYVGRFNSEYGMQAILNLESVRQFCPEDEWDIDSASMQVHERHVQGWPLIKHYMEQYMVPPTSFRKYIYGSQILQHYSLSLAITSLRAAKPFNMGSLYWQINDVWPVVSWSTVDYYGCWKAAHYAAKKYHQPTILALINDTQLYLVTEQNHVAMQSIQVAIMDSAGTVSSTIHFSNVTATSQSSQFIAALPSIKSQSQFFLMSLNHLYFPAFLGRPRHFQLQPPSYKYSWISDDQMELVSATVMRWVQVSVQGECFNLDDNYFDLIPGTIH